MAQRFSDFGLAHQALDAADAAGASRYFRVSAKYPAACACCGHSIRVGQMAAKVSPGTLLAVCCILDLHDRAARRR
jgi:hypothetical protein